MNQDTEGVYVEIRGNADSLVNATNQGEESLRGLEGVSAEAFARLSSAIERLDLDFTKFAEGAHKGGTAVKQSGEAAVHTGEQMGVLGTFVEDVGKHYRIAANAAEIFGIKSEAAAAKLDGLSRIVAGMQGAVPSLLALGGGITAVFAGFEFLKDSTDSASRWQQNLEILGRTVADQGAQWGRLRDSVIAWGEAQEKVTTYSRDDVVSALRLMTSAGTGLADSMKIVQVAEDAAAATGHSLTDVVHGLMEAEHGRTQVLAELGIGTRAQIHDGMTLQQVLQQIEQHMGGAAAQAADTYAGKLDQLHNTFETLKEGVGEDLLPVLERVVDKTKDWVQLHTDDIVNFFGETITFGEDLAKDVLPGLEDLVKQLARTAGDVSGANQLASDGTTTWGNFGTVLEGVAGAFGDIAEDSAHAVRGWNDFSEGATRALGPVQRALDAIDATIMDIVGGLTMVFNRTAGHSELHMASDLWSASLHGSPFEGEAGGSWASPPSHQAKPPSWGSNLFSLGHNPQIGLGSSKGSGGQKKVDAQRQINDEINKSMQYLERLRQANQITDDQWIAGLKRIEGEYQTTAMQRATIDAKIAEIEKSERSQQEQADAKSISDYQSHMEKRLEIARNTFGEHSQAYRDELENEIGELQHWLDAHKNADQKVLDNFRAMLAQRQGDVRSFDAWQQQQQDESLKKKQEAWQTEHDRELAIVKGWAEKSTTVIDGFFTHGKDGMRGFADAFRQMLDDMLKSLEQSAISGFLERALKITATTNSPYLLPAGVPGMSLAPAGAGADPALVQAYMAVGMSQSDAIDMASMVAPSSASAAAPGGSPSALASLGAGKIPWGKSIGGASVGSYLAAAAGGALVGQTVFGGKGYADVGGALGATAALALAGPAGWAAVAAMSLGGALLGGEGGSLFGNHFNPANEPDVYQTGAWGQANADMNGNTSASPMIANGQSFVMDSWTQQATGGKGWNLTMEKFVQLFRGKTSSLPQNLRDNFNRIEQLWGGATNQPNFNHDGKDGWLDIGSGTRAKWTEFWQYVQQYGPQISQLVDQYQTSDVYTSSNGVATQAGPYTPSGSPNILHDFPDYGVPYTAPSNPGGGSPSPSPSPGPITNPNPQPITGPPHHPMPMVVQQFNVHGSLVTENEIYKKANLAAGQSSRVGTIRRLNALGK